MAKKSLGKILLIDSMHYNFKIFHENNSYNLVFKGNEKIYNIYCVEYFHFLCIFLFCGILKIFENLPYILHESMTSLFPWIREEDFVNDVTICSSALAQDDVDIEVDALATASVRRH